MALRSNSKMFILVGLICASVGAFGIWMGLRRSEAIPPNTFSRVHFAPDSVREIQWKVGDSNATYQRRATASPWSPAADAEKVQRVLNWLSSVTLTSSEAIQKPSLEFEFGLANGEKWKGQFKGERFVWSSGPLSGQGMAVDDQGLGLFQSGRFAFESTQLQWCPERPIRVTLSEDGKDIALERRELKWFLASNGVERELDPTFIEKWLGEHCSDSAVWIRDLRHFPTKWLAVKGELNFDFEKGESKKFDVFTHLVKLDDERAIEPKKLLNGLRALSSQP